MGGELSAARFRGIADRLRDPPFGPEHRLPRGRPPGRDGRSRLAGRALFRRGRQPAPRPCGRPHGGAHHLPVGCGAAPQVRPQVPGPRQSRPSRSMPISRSRAICATRARPSSSGSTPTPISISPARWTISTSPRTMTACSPTPSRRRRPGSASSRSPADWLFPTSDSRAIVHALNAAGARVSFAEIATDKGHDAFLLDEPELFQIVRRLPRFRRGCARHRRQRASDAVATAPRPDHGRSGARAGQCPRRSSSRRRDDRAQFPGARRRLRRRRIAEAPGEPRRRRARHRAVARGRQRLRRQGPRRDPGRRRHRPRRLSRTTPSTT